MPNQAPWRYVTDPGRLTLSNRRSSKLECGHWYRTAGQQAIDAAYVKRRRCKTCQQLLAEFQNQVKQS